MNGTGWKRFLIVVVFASVAFGPSRLSAQTTLRTIAKVADISGSVESTAGIVGPSVVEIFTTSYVPARGVVPRAADLVTTERSSGSGVIVDAGGYILTNAHVVRGAQRLQVALPSPVTGRSILATATRTVNAQIVGIDSETDLAVLKVDERNLPALAFADSDELRPGQVVLAFGSPLGLHNSVSLGVVSAVARQLDPESPMIYVQTDASINPGSSGGPLVDLRGRLVGINTLIISQAGGNEGLGFAAPSNIAQAIYEQLKKNGRVRRGDIGVRAQTVTPLLASGLGLPREHGVILSDVLPGSPAAQAGLLPGDLVTMIDEKPMENGRQLQIRLYRHAPGDVVSLDLLRAGMKFKIPVTIVERQDDYNELPVPADPRENLVVRLGILGVNMDQRIAKALPARRSTGVVVASAVTGAVDAREGGLAAGDVIYAINQVRVPGLAGLREALDNLKTGEPVVLQVERQGMLMYLTFVMD
jgi:serine protease Do